MTDTPKRLAGPVKPSKAAAGTTLYDPASGTLGVVKNVLATNTDPVFGAFLWLSVGDMTTLANRVASGLYVPPGKTLSLPLDLIINGTDGDDLRAKQVSVGQPDEVVVTAMANVTNTTDASSWATGSWTAKNGAVYLLTVVNTKASSPDQPSSFTDTHSGVTWTLLQTIVDTANGTRLSQYIAQSTGTTNTTTTVGFPANQTGISAFVTELLGADSSGTNGDAGVYALGTFEQTVAGTAPILLVGDKDFSQRTIVSMGLPAVATTHTALTGWGEIADANYATPSTSCAVAFGQFPATMYRPTFAASATGGTLAAFAGFQTAKSSLAVSVNGVEVT